ncbi:MAG: aldo/keto reductase [Acidiferrobacterales bacterium]|nr:aldo/keto reductase [Acidiferrobacterales bacterium]
MQLNRRQLLQLTSAGALQGWCAPLLAESKERIFKPIPSTGEEIPLIGMGTWITFNVGDNTSLRDARCQVLSRFFELGGRMVDSSPMYGSAEDVLGYCETREAAPKQYFRTTKVWTSSDSEGRSQIADSYRLWKTKQFGLFQVHNLVNWRSHLPYLLDLKAEGKIRYVGISTSHGRRHRDLAHIMQNQDIDFVQLTYNLADREVEERLLPLAADKGIGVIVNRPFRRGGLFDRLNGVPIPDWAASLGCENMAQIMLKFIVSHPSVTCAIPATSQLAHLEENMAAQYGPMPDSATRKEMISWFERV